MHSGALAWYSQAIWTFCTVDGFSQSKHPMGSRYTMPTLFCFSLTWPWKTYNITYTALSWSNSHKLLRFKRKRMRRVWKNFETFIKIATCSHRFLWSKSCSGKGQRKLPELFLHNCSPVTVVSQSLEPCIGGNGLDQCHPGSLKECRSYSLYCILI